MSEGLKNVIGLNAKKDSQAILSLDGYKSVKVLSQVTGLIAKVGGTRDFVAGRADGAIHNLHKHKGVLIYVSNHDYIHLL